MIILAIAVVAVVIAAVGATGLHHTRIMPPEYQDSGMPPPGPYYRGKAGRWTKALDIDPWIT